MGYRKRCRSWFIYVGKDTVTGIWDFITELGEILSALGNAVIHPVKTYDAISAATEESYQKVQEPLTKQIQRAK